MAPGESTSKTAPQPLYPVQRFVNSIDLESGEDVSSPEALRDWFAERGLMDSADAVEPADLRRAIDVREGLRAVLQAQQRPPARHGARGAARPPPSGGRACACASRGRDPELVPDADGVDGAVARLMAIVAAAVEHGRWERLACPREECEWAFFDKSKNRSGRWCSMESCGNIEKAKAFRERQRR